MAGSQQDEIKRILADNDASLEKLRVFGEQQVSVMKEDIMSLSKFFYTSADLASSYLRDQLVKPLSQSTEKQESLKQLFQNIVSNQRQITPAQLQECHQIALVLQKEIGAFEKEKKSYKQSPKTKQFWEDIYGVYQRFVKDMFRKMKRLMHSTTDSNDGLDQSLIQEFDTLKERLDDALAKLANSSGNKILRELPENLPKLPAFPSMAKSPYLELANMYGPFNPRPDAVNHPTFAQSKKLPPVKVDEQSMYEGEWYQGLRNGFGRALFKDGTLYEGYWLNDKPEFLGRMISADGDLYEVRFHL